MGLRRRKDRPSGPCFRARARRIINREVRAAAMRDHDGKIVHEIETLLAAHAGADAPSLAALEDALTAGYAHALALEAERWRLERRLGELAAELADGTIDERADELGRLARLMSAADGELEGLRAVLSRLRDRASAARAIEAA
jgi:ABC-type phosphate transport system auxiliary subunit